MTGSPHRALRRPRSPPISWSQRIGFLAANDDRHLIETLLESESVFDGRLLHVRRDLVRLPDGGEATREYVVHPGAVLIVPVLADGRYVLERQFRYPVGRVMLEFPAGKIDSDELPLATAQRELREEAGYTAKVWQPLGIVHPEIGYSTEAIEMFAATGLTHVGAQLDEGEFLDVVLLTEDELLAAFDAGGMTDGKSVAALFAWIRFRARPP